MVTLIACDLDGTLLNEHHQISTRTLALLQRLPHCGIQFMAATGRMQESVLPLFSSVLPECEYVLLNGALIMDSKQQIVYELPLSKASIKRVHEAFRETDLCYHMYTSDGTIGIDQNRAVMEMKAHMMGKGMEEWAIDKMMKEDNFCHYEREIQDMDAFLKEDVTIYKMEAFGSQPKKIEQARALLSTHCDVAVTNSIADNIEVTDQSAQKGIALEHYCKLRGIPKEEVVVIGDSLNDLSMMECFPNSIAMKNGAPCVKQAASYVSTYTNAEDGVAHILEEIINTLSISGK